MSVQLALRFDEVPITCETQQRYHSIAPCLAGKRSAEEQADALRLSYSTVCIPTHNNSLDDHELIPRSSHRQL
jgi:hypothetical protein